MKRTFLSTVVVAALSGASASSIASDNVLTGSTVEQLNVVEAAFDKKKLLADALKAGNDRIRVIIQLEDAPLAQFAPVNPMVREDVAAKGQKVNFASNSAKEYQSFLKSQQQKLISLIKSFDTSFSADFQYSASFNGFAGAIDKNKLDALSALPNVKAVYPDTVRHAQMDASLDLVNTMQVWEKLGGREDAGKGVRVAVLDSGIRPENPMFSGEGFEAPAADSLPTDDYCSEVPDFCNNKLIAARHAEVPDFFDVVPEEHDSPLGFNGHGTHVAGTAVGNYGVMAERDGAEAEISGVAPAAYLMVYKGLYATPANPASSSGVDSMLLSMLDAALLDGADVINNSWGGGPGGSPDGSPYEDVFAAMKDAGIVNVFAAGNDGPGSTTIGCPGCSDNVLTVANTTTNRLFANEVSVDDAGEDFDSIPALFSGPVPVTDPITAPIIYAGEVEEANFEGCTPYADETTFTDSIALVSRGSCNFTDKVDNAANAGASAILIFNQAGRGEAPISMLLNEDHTIPSLMLPATPGIALADYLLETEDTVTATIGSEVVRTTSDSLQDIMNESSSRGPNGNPSFLKPNLAAPGTRIFSAESPEAPGHVGENFSFKNGTSMASPHVAGAAALLKQMHPDWSVSQINSALVASSVRDGLVKEDAATPADNFDLGAGRLDVARASTVQLTYSDVSMVNGNCYIDCDLTITVTNTSGEAIDVSPTIVFDDAGVEASISPADATLPAGASAEVTLSLNVANATGEQWALGGVNWTDGNSETTDYFVPVAVFATRSDKASLFQSNVSSSAAAPGESVEVEAVANNEDVTGLIEIVGHIDHKYDINPATLSAIKNGNQEAVSWDSETREIHWQGALNTGSMTIEPSTDIADALAGFNITGYFSMANVVDPLTCSSVCDDTFIEVGLPQPVTYFGTEYTSMQISSNGFVSLGSSSGSVANSTVHLLPGLSEPNNVVAPFWIDFDLDGTSDTDTGGGSIYAVSLVTGHFVVEWANAQLYQYPDQVFNVQLWFNYATGAVNYVYGPMGAPTLEQASLGLVVGAENSAGTVGITSAAQTLTDTFGVLPVEGDEVILEALSGDRISVSYAGTVSSPAQFMDDSGTVEEDSSLMMNVLSNDMDTTVLNTFEMKSLSGDFRTFTPIEITGADVDQTSVEIAASPANGSATVSADGYVTYTPNADYYGSDEFTYTVMDTDGELFGTGAVSVMVQGVQDAPSLTVTAPDSVREGELITVSASATDADGDDIQYTINGVPGQTLSITAPETGDAGTSVSFTVAASDGIDTTTETVTVRVTNKAGGSAGWLTLLLLPLVYMRRRKH